LIVVVRAACDFFWKARMVDLDRDDAKLDIHHIFPKKWCEDRNIPPRVFNAIINKTAISYKANRMIGGSAPSKYLAQLQGHAQVKLDQAAMDTILKSHFIEPARSTCCSIAATPVANVAHRSRAKHSAASIGWQHGGCARNS
jgi:hypothetical protein